MKLAYTDAEVLLHVKGQRGHVMQDSVFWNGVRRQAANRLVKRGLLTTRNYANGGAYEVTDAGLAAAEKL